jgi:hypothetical protein
LGQSIIISGPIILAPPKKKYFSSSPKYIFYEVYKLKSKEIASFIFNVDSIKSLRHAFTHGPPPGRAVSWDTNQSGCHEGIHSVSYTIE